MSPRIHKLAILGLILSAFLLCFEFQSVECRFQYHQQGVKAKTGIPYYRFGYEAKENGNNPLTRYEISEAPGYVKGQYSYLTNDNKIQIIEYESTPTTGMKIRLVNIIQQ